MSDSERFQITALLLGCLAVLLYGGTRFDDTVSALFGVFAIVLLIYSLVMKEDSKNP